MKTGFALTDGALVPVTAADRAQILAYTAPDQDEKREVIQNLSMDLHDLESALYADEIARVEFLADRVAIVWK